MGSKTDDKTQSPSIDKGAAVKQTVDDAVPKEHDHERWFKEHYEDAADQIIDFIEADDLSLEGKAVADIGCGDGIIDLGVFHKAKPEKLIGYDILKTDLKALERTVEAMDLDDPIPDPEQFNFVQSAENYIPAEDDSFDFAYTWSVFEHVTEPIHMLGEIRRVLKPEGILFLQIWPLFHSSHGGHLWLSYPEEDYPQLRKNDSEIESDIQLKAATNPEISAVDEYKSLNRLTIDDLQRAILAGGMRVTKLEVQSEVIHIPHELSRFPLSSLGISGVKLLAVPVYDALDLSSSGSA